MIHFLEWLLGLKSLPRGRIEEIDIHFLLLPERHGAVVFFILALAAAVFTWWIYKKRKQILGKWRWGLSFFRIGAIILLLLLLCGPVLKLVTHDVNKSILVLLADNSASMSIVDRKQSAERMRKNGIALGYTELKNKQTDIESKIRKRITEAKRIDILKHILADDDTGLIDTFSEKYSISNYSFGQKLVPGGADYADWLKKAAADENRTALGRAMDRILENTRGENVAGMIILTDGSNNAGEDPGVAAEKAGDRSVPCYFIGIGEPDVKDIQITFLAMRDIMFAGDPAPVR